MSKNTAWKESEKRKQKADIFLWDSNAGNTKESWTFGFGGVVYISVPIDFILVHSYQETHGAVNPFLSYMGITGPLGTCLLFGWLLYTAVVPNPF